MRRSSMGIASSIAVLFLAANANAQETTEQFIPVGQSPGISGTYSYIGEIQAVDAQARTVTVAGPEGARTIKVTDETRIWLDRSQQRQSNTVGDMSDLQTGRRCEVKYTDYDTKEEAAWIKVVVSG